MKSASKKLNLKKPTPKVKVNMKRQIYKEIKILSSKKSSLTRMKTLTSSLNKKGSFGTVSSTRSDRNFLDNFEEAINQKNQPRNIEEDRKALACIQTNIHRKSQQLLEERKRIHGSCFVTFANEVETLKSSNASSRSRGRKDSNHKPKTKHLRRRTTMYKPTPNLKPNIGNRRSKSGEGLEVILRKFKKDARSMSIMAHNTRSFKRRNSQMMKTNNASPFIKNKGFFITQKAESPIRINKDKKINNFVFPKENKKFESVDKKTQESTEKFTDFMFNTFMVKSVDNYLHRQSDGCKE
ncbi:unnamed protein product [Moneuplotes crassus]|uniref:Uncharacterized protein n=1 Tax=Euplotes crassus TaxID=5936 RepID=A0AAD1UKM6_EUPCR|nr:unnamed protein product [Moneuplotes crassus]